MYVQVFFISALFVIANEYKDLDPHQQGTGTSTWKADGHGVTYSADLKRLISSPELCRAEEEHDSH